MDKIISQSKRLKRKAISVYLISFLCLFLPYRSPLADFVANWMRVLPDALIALFFLYSVISEKFHIKFRKYDFIYLAFLLWAFLSTVIINHVSIQIYLIEVRSISLYYLLFFVVRDLYYDDTDCWVILRALHISLYSLFVFAAIEKIFNKTIFFPKTVAQSIEYEDNFVRTYSMFYNPNTYAAFIFLSILITWYLQTQRHIKVPTLFYVIAFTSLLLTISRSTILLTVVFLAVFLIIAFKHNSIKTKFLIKKCITVFLLFGVLYSALIGANKIFNKTSANSNHIFQPHSSESQSANDNTLGEDESGVNSRFKELFTSGILKKSQANGRLGSIAKGLLIWTDHPVFGTGFGTYGSAASMNWHPPIYKEYKITSSFYSDNDFIRNLVETGLVGFILYYLALFALFKDYRKNIFSNSLFIAVIWLSLFYNTFEVQIVSLLFWTLLGMIGNEKSNKKIQLPEGRERALQSP